MASPDPRQVAVILDRIKGDYPQEVAALASYIEQIDSADKLLDLVKDVSEMKGRALSVMERIEPTYQRAVKVWEREQDLKDRELELKDKELAIIEQRNEQRMTMVVRPVVAAIVAFIAGLATSFREVIIAWVQQGGPGSQ